MSLKVVILAAGKGSRMKSNLPKVLQPLAGKPLLCKVIDTALKLNPSQIINIVGHQAEVVQSTINKLGYANLIWVEQTEQLGTGHAVQQVIPHLAEDDKVIILYGDVPLINQTTLENLASQVTDKTPLSLLTANLANPFGYGRIIRSANRIAKIVEQKDATQDELLVDEINSGILAGRGGQLISWLNKLENNNAQQEFYLTDIIAMAVADGYEVQSCQPADEIEILGVNDKLQLQALERLYQKQQAENLMLAGATLIDASRIDIRGEVSLGMDCELDNNVILEGSITLGNNVKIGANCYLKDVEIADNTEILPFCHLENAQVGVGCVIGPYARLRPGSKLDDAVKIGNFVEVKASSLGRGSKVNHLSYIGDTQMGAEVNIGAGTITCNYDGANKHQTLIGDRVFVGSATQLVAPVKIEDDATIGAGSTITKTAPAATLTLTRVKQMSLSSWTRPKKDK